jgi:outer membrane murein-binding lipoprotein Lpp
MTPPRTDHICTKEAEISELTQNFDKLDDTINSPEGLVAKVNTLVNMVTPMAGDVKTATEFILRTKEREKLQKEENNRKNRNTNTWVNIGIAVVALGAFIVSIFALKGCAPL